MTEVAAKTQVELLTHGELEYFASLVRLKQERKNTPINEIPCEVTACIPCLDSLSVEFGTLPDTLHSLKPGHQSLPIKLVLCDNGSKDGTQLLLRAMSEAGDPWDPNQTVRQFWLQRFPRGIQIAEAVPQNEEYPPGQARRNHHMKLLHSRLVKCVDTPYVLTVDSDVDVPKGAVRTMLDALKEDSKLGMVGIRYDWNAGHVQHGLTMMATELRKEVLDRLPGDLPANTCTCLWVHNEVKRLGLKSLHLSLLSARHTRLERG